MTDEKLLLFKLHPCSHGLSTEELEEIVNATEVVRFERGDAICRADEPVNFVYLIVHGRIRLELLDVHGKLVLHRFQTAGGQFGAMAASLAEPTSVNCTAEDPTVLLRIDYLRVLELCRKFTSFRANYMRMIADSVKQALLHDSAPVRPQLVLFVHQSDETRVVSRTLAQRLAELGETPCFFCDRSTDLPGVQVVRISADEPYEVLSQQAADWLERGRVVFDVNATADPERAGQGFEKM